MATGGIWLIDINLQPGNWNMNSKQRSKEKRVRGYWQCWPACWVFVYVPVPPHVSIRQILCVPFKSCRQRPSGLMLPSHSASIGPWICRQGLSSVHSSVHSPTPSLSWTFCMLVSSCVEGVTVLHYPLSKVFWELRGMWNFETQVQLCKHRDKQ